MGNEIAKQEPKPQHTSGDNHAEAGGLGSTAMPQFDYQSLMQDAGKIFSGAKELGGSARDWINNTFQIVDPTMGHGHQDGRQSSVFSGKAAPGDETITVERSKPSPENPNGQVIRILEKSSQPKVMDGIDVLPNNRSSQRPAPPYTAAETPNSDAISTANETIERLADEGDGRLIPHNAPISAETQVAMQALVSGDMTQIQSMLKEMEGDSIGKEKLQAMARELTSILSTTVNVIDNNGQYSLDVLTNFQNATSGGYLGGFSPEKESHLTISSSGEVTAEQRSGSLDRFGIYGKERAADLALNSDTETTRLQALAVNGLAAQVQMAKQMSSIEKTANGMTHSQMEKTVPKVFRDKETLERLAPTTGPKYALSGILARQYKLIADAIAEDNLDK